MNRLALDTEPSEMNSVQQWKQLYDMGFSLIPLVKAGKIPIRGVHWTAYQDTRADWSRVEQWNRIAPDANIGIVTGAVSGIFVIDCDSEEAFELLKENGIGNPVLAKSGRGYHLYYACPHCAIRTRTGWRPGVDVRGEGGYIVAPPSLHTSGKRYQWIGDPKNIPTAIAPDWMLDQLTQPDPLQSQEPSENLPVPSADRYLTQQTDRIRQARNGTRNTQLNASAYGVGQMIGQGHIDEASATHALANAARENGLTAKEISATISSGIAAGKRNSNKISVVTPTTVNSEADFADRFVHLYGDSFRFCHSSKRWFQFDENRWQPDNTERVKQQMLGVIRSMSAAKSDNKASRVAGAMSLAMSHQDISLTAEDWDTNPYLLGTPDGTINLRTGRLYLPDPSDHITKSTACTPQEGTPTTWLAFLNDATGGDHDMIRYLQQICGYSLTGDTREQCLFFLLGPGGNGKSVFVNTLKGILGDYAVTSTMEAFTEQKYATHSTDLAMLRGARLVSASENEHESFIAQARIKQITGGDPVTARYMRQDNFTFIPQFKLVLMGNHAPRLKSVDDAIRRRFNIIPFNFKPDNPDKDLELKLRAEWPMILSWMIDGCMDWQNNGLKRPTNVSGATEEFLDAQDTFSVWLDYACRVHNGNSGLSTPCTKAYQSYCDFARNNGATPETMIGFGKRLSKLGIKSHLRRNQANKEHERHYIGLELIH